MVPWGLLATAAAYSVFPHHRGAILVVSAVASLVRGGRKRERRQRTCKAAGGKAAPETGGAHVEWSRISCVLQDKRSGSVRKILLSEIVGAARPGRLLAIMGPSGAGKTTLLNVLAGQLPASAAGGTRTVLHGTVLVDGVPLVKSSHRQAYIRQDDALFSQLTVRETLLFAAKLRLPASMSDGEKEAAVNDLLGTMGLSKVASTIVGSAKVRGISGGERKRLSVACELLGDPSVVFADEPTTGLDAFQAERVMASLRSLAQQGGKTVICSIHQPRGSVYDMFDDVILLSEGELVYSGPAGNAPLQYLAALGHNCPEHSNPAEFLADLVGVDHTSPETEAASSARLRRLVAAFRAGSSTEAAAAPPAAHQQPKQENGIVALAQVPRCQPHAAVQWWRTFKLLLSRAWKQTVRDKQTNFVRAMMNLTSALIFGAVFWRMGLRQTTIQDRLGLLQVAAINTAMASLTKTLNVFPGERLIVRREVAEGAYPVAPYFASKLLAELPVGAVFPAIFGVVVYPLTGLHQSLSRFARFLAMTTAESFTASAMGLTVGCIAPSTEAAMALGPSLMTVFIVFGGYYVNADNTPLVFRWIPSVSLIRWGFQGLCVNEFRGLRFEARSPSDVRTGEQVLRRLGFPDTGAGLGEALRREASIAAFWYWASLSLLQRNEARYAPLLPPPEQQGGVNGAANGQRKHVAENGGKHC